MAMNFDANLKLDLILNLFEMVVQLFRCSAESLLFSAFVGISYFIEQLNGILSVIPNQQGFKVLEVLPVKQ
jgi:hypothetical protein